MNHKEVYPNLDVGDKLTLDFDQLWRILTKKLYGYEGDEHCEVVSMGSDGITLVNRSTEMPIKFRLTYEELDRCITQESINAES